MDFTGPIGRGRPEETLVLDRNTMSSDAHYIKGSDEKLMAVLPISFSCFLDDTVNQDYIMDALVCGNPGKSSLWDATGVSTKQDTKNDGTNYNPALIDSTNKKCVDIQMVFAGSTLDQGLAFYEVYFPREECSITEGADGIVLNAAGGVYGLIETIGGLGDRY